MKVIRRVAYLKLSSVIIILTICVGLLLSLNVGSKVQRYFYGVKKGVTLEGVMMEGLLKKEVYTRVEKMASAINRPPRNARYDKKNKIILSELPGLMVDVKVTVAAVLSAQLAEEVGLTLIRLEPELTAELFHSIDQKIASFSTNGGGSAGRTDNLYVAAKYMNGTILAPGDVFSFNQLTGPRTFARGYSMAPVVGGVGIGGGVCQVATTIYNTALAAKLEIIERHPHSIQVGYVRPGRDATVTNYIDFKFRNSTDRYIQIRSEIGRAHV